MSLVRVVALGAVLMVASPAGAKAPSYELINLYDAFGDEPDGTTEHFGLSTLIRYGDTTILFDAGTMLREQYANHYRFFKLGSRLEG